MSKQGSLDKYFVKRKQNNGDDGLTKRYCAENENLIFLKIFAYPPDD
jgi:hypothetical protein